MRNYRTWLVALVVVLLGLAWTDTALGRAGGGEAFDSDDSSSSSSDSGSSPDSGSDSSSTSSTWSDSDSSSHSSSSGGASAGNSSVIAFAFLFLVLVILSIQKLKRRVSGLAAAATPAVPARGNPRNPSLDQRQLTDLIARDPAFSEDEFKKLATKTFRQVQQAWSGRDMAPAAAGMTPAVMQRFTIQLSEMKRDGRTNHVEKLSVDSVKLVEASHDGSFDYLVVLISAAAADFTTDDRTGALVSGSTEPKPFSEYWTFMRSDQVKSGAAVEMKSCPQCGGPVSVNAVGKCDHCGSDMTSGEFGWVLSEIVQPSMWKPRAS